MNNLFYIYTLIDPLTGRIRYVGKTQYLNTRYRNHCNASKFENTHKGHWINKLIRSNLQPIMEIIETVSNSNEATKREIFWIAKFRQMKYPLTNGTEGGDGMTNPTEETRRKLSKSLTGRKRAPFSKEWKEKIGRANRGKKHPPRSTEWSNRIRVALIKRCKNNPKELERLRKMAGNWKGRKHSKETRIKIGLSRLGRKFPRKVKV